MQRSASYMSYTDDQGHEVVILSSDEDDEPPPTPKPLAKGKAKAPSRPLRDHNFPSFTSVDDIIHPADAPDEDLPDFFQYSQTFPIQQTARASVGSKAAALLQDLSSSPEAPISKKRKQAQASAAFDETPTPSQQPKRPRTTTDAAKNDKALKAAEKKLEAEAKKLAKEQEKIAKAAAKQAKKEADAAAKQNKALYKKLNNLVTNKKRPLKDITIEISEQLYNAPTFRPVLRPLEEQIRKAAAAGATKNDDEDGDEEDNDSDDDDEDDNSNPNPWPITKFTPEARFGSIPCLIRWSRYIYAKYSESAQQWEPVAQPYHRHEGLYLMHFHISQFQAVMDGNPAALGKALQHLRKELSDKHQLFLMIDGFQNKKNGLNAHQRDAIEKTLAELQVLYRCFVVHVDGVQNTATWLYNITADLGIKPHKLIERSHLPFCAQTKNKVASSGTKDLYLRMLQEIYRVTEPMAQEIVRSRYATLRSLFDAYDNPTITEKQKKALLVGIGMGTKGGRPSTRSIGDVISSRVHAVITGGDSLALVGCKGNGDEE